MISKEEVRELLKSTETYRIERTTSTGDMDKFQEAICAFSNDLPNSIFHPICNVFCLIYPIQKRMGI